MILPSLYFLHMLEHHLSFLKHSASSETINNQTFDGAYRRPMNAIFNNRKSPSVCNWMTGSSTKATSTPKQPRVLCSLASEEESLLYNHSLPEHFAQFQPFLGFGVTGEFLILPSVCCSRWKIFRRSCHQCWSLWNVSWDQFPGKDDLEILSPGRQIVTNLGGVNVLCLALRLQRSALLFYPPICNFEQNTWYFVLRVKTSPRHWRCQCDWCGARMTFYMSRI